MAAKILNISPLEDVTSVAEKSIVEIKVGRHELLRDSFFKLTQFSWLPFCQVLKCSLASPEEGSARLIQLVHILSDEITLKKVRDQLSIHELECWEKFIHTERIQIKDVLAIWRQLELEVKKKALTVSGDDELDLIITSLTPQTACRFIKENPALAPTLIQELPANMAAEVFNDLDTDEVLKLVSLGGTIPKQGARELKAALEAYLEIKDNQFVKTIGAMSGSLSESKKNIILQNILTGGNLETARQLAMDIIPEEAIHFIPSETMQTLVSDIDLALRVEFLSLLEESDQKHWLSLMASEGSKGMDMLMMELEQIKGDEAALSRLKGKANNVRSAFYARIRDKLNSSDYLSLKKEIITLWLESKGNAA